MDKKGKVLDLLTIMAMIFFFWALLRPCWCHATELGSVGPIETKYVAVGCAEDAILYT